MPRTILLLFLVTGAVLTPAWAQTGKIVVEIREAESQPKGVDACNGLWCNGQDFYLRVAFPPYATWAESAEISDRDRPSWAPPFTVTQDVSKLVRYHDVKIELWDRDDLTQSDIFDLTPLFPNELTVHFDACTNTWEEIGMPLVHGPGLSFPPFGTRDWEFNGRVVLDVHTDGRIPFTTNDVSVVDLNPVQVAFSPESVISGKATSMAVTIASTYTGPTPQPATITVIATDGTSSWQESRAEIIPPGLSTFYFFDGTRAGSTPFRPVKPPNTDRLDLVYSATVDYDDIAPPGTSPDFIDCYQLNNGVLDKRTPIVRTVDPRPVFVPFDFLDSAFFPSNQDISYMATGDELFRRAIWPLATTTHSVSAVPILAFWNPIDPFTFFAEPYRMLADLSTGAKLSGIERMVLVTRKGWFKDNDFRAFFWPDNSIGLSLGEFGGHAVLVEHGYRGVSTHELGHTYRLSQRKCQHDTFNVGCRDEYTHSVADGAPYMARGLDVEGTIFPAGKSFGEKDCVAPASGTREVCLRNFMDSQNDSQFINWTDTETFNFLAQELREGLDPEIVNLSGWIRSPNGFTAGVPPIWEGRLDYAFHTMGVPDLQDPLFGDPPASFAGAGPFAVKLRTAFGEKVYRFQPNFFGEGGETPLDEAYFSFFVPWEPGALSVALYAPENPWIGECGASDCREVLVFERILEPVPPSIVWLQAGRDGSPLPGASSPPPTIGPGHSVVISWQALDAQPDVEGLRSFLLLSRVDSAGGPEQFLPWGLHLLGSELTIPQEALAGAPGRYMARVVVSNGLLSSELTNSNLFSICNLANGGVERCDGVDDDCDGTVDDAIIPDGGHTVSVSRDTISWSVNLGAESYDLVRGDVGTLVATGGAYADAADECLVSTTTATSESFTLAPVPGHAFWFLVRARNCAGVGSYDELPGTGQRGSRDAGLAASGNDCQ